MNSDTPTFAPAFGVPAFGSRLEIVICGSGDPAVYNNICTCSHIIHQDGTRTLYGECYRCKHALKIILPPLCIETSGKDL